MLTHFDQLAQVAAWLVFPLGLYVLARGRHWGQEPLPLRRALVLGTSFAAAGLFYHAFTTVRHLAQWDFACFWLYGHAALSHGNVYAPATFRALPLPMAVDAEFRREIIDVGFPYPPPSILLFAPLGVFASMTVASVPWILALLVALALGVAASAEDLPPIGFWAVAALAVAMPAARDNVSLMQTSPLAFALLAGTYALRRSFLGGVLAALAFVVKPYLLVVPLWLALRRRWNALAAWLATSLILLAASIPFLGPGGLHAYLSEAPTSRLPASVLTEYWGASIYSAIARVQGLAGPLSPTAPLHDTVYLAVTAVLVPLTLWAVIRAPSQRDALSLSLMVTLALLLYPGTNSPYVVVLVFAFVAVARAADGGRPLALALACCGLVFCILNANHGATTTLALIATWGILVVLVVATRRSSAEDRILSGLAPTPGIRA